MKLLLFSDLHLDAQFAWLGARPELAAARRQGLRDTLVNILRLAEDAAVDALLCGGDLYEQERWTPDTAAFLRTAFERIHPLPVFIAPGNHDWYGPASLYHQTHWSPNVRIFREDVLHPVTLADGLTLWGAAHRAPANTDGFLERFRVDRAGVHLALFHGSEQGFLAQQEDGKQPHAAFRSDQIEAAGLQHAMLGHFHRPRAAERFTYPGNPDPLTFGEDGERGAVLLTVDGNGQVQRDWYAVNATQVHSFEADISACVSLQDVRDLVAEIVRPIGGFVRITLHGDLDPNIDLQPDRLVNGIAGAQGVVIRLGNIHPAYDLDSIGREPTVRGQFVRDVLAAAELDEEARRRVLVTGLRALDGRSDLDVA